MEMLRLIGTAGLRRLEDAQGLQQDFGLFRILIHDHDVQIVEVLSQMMEVEHGHVRWQSSIPEK